MKAQGMCRFDPIAIESDTGFQGSMLAMSHHSVVWPAVAGQPT